MEESKDQQSEEKPAYNKDPNADPNAEEEDLDSFEEYQEEDLDDFEEYPIGEDEPQPDTDPDEDDSFSAIDRRERKESRNRGGRLLLGIALTLAAVAAVGGIAYALFVGNGEDEEETQPEAVEVTLAEPESETIEEEEEEGDSGYLHPDAGYLGYWNRPDHKDEELTVVEITDVYVVINLWWKDVFEAANVKAYFSSDNVASFSCTKEDLILTGKLYFMRDSEKIRENIMLEVTQSNVEKIPEGSIVFTQQHDEAWYEPVLEFSADTSNEVLWEEGDLILPDVATKKLTEDDIKDFDLEKTQYAIAEIYARHQCKFEDSTLQEYFDSKWWYDGYTEQKDFSESVFNEYEAANLALLRQREAQLKGELTQPDAGTAGQEAETAGQEGAATGQEGTAAGQ